MIKTNFVVAVYLAVLFVFPRRGGGQRRSLKLENASDTEGSRVSVREPIVQRFPWHLLQVG